MPWAKSCSSSSVASLTMWHHLRPRNHHRGSSMSTAIASSLPAGGRRRETGRISDDAELRAAWTAAVGDGPAALAALDDVVARHREPHRRYHGVRHVTWVVRHVHELATEVAVADLGAVVVAAFFHDAVYDPRPPTTRSRAPRWPSGCSPSSAGTRPAGRRSATLVRATAAHAATDDADTAVLLDADLAVLGAEPAAYQAYVTGVRAEYAHVDADDVARRPGRVLRDLLAHRPLYATAPGRARWEAGPRANMAAELAAL